MDYEQGEKLKLNILTGRKDQVLFESVKGRVSVFKRVNEEGEKSVQD